MVAAHREGTLLFGDGRPIFGDGQREAEAARRGGDVAAGVDVELGEDVTNVVIDGLRREIEARGDLGVAPARGEEGQNLQLAGGQVGGVGAGARVRPAGNGAGATLPQPPRRQSPRPAVPPVARRS